ncbi:hypothetical protein D3C87_1037320 [compost metagenome]
MAASVIASVANAAPCARASNSVRSHAIIACQRAESAAWKSKTSGAGASKLKHSRNAASSACRRMTTLKRSQSASGCSRTGSDGENTRTAPTGISAARPPASSRQRPAVTVWITNSSLPTRGSISIARP